MFHPRSRFLFVKGLQTKYGRADRAEPRRRERENPTPLARGPLARGGSLFGWEDDLDRLLDRNRGIGPRCGLASLDLDLARRDHGGLVDHADSVGAGCHLERLPDRGLELSEGLLAHGDDRVVRDRSADGEVTGRREHWGRLTFRDLGRDLEPEALDLGLGRGDVLGVFHRGFIGLEASQGHGVVAELLIAARDIPSQGRIFVQLVGTFEAFERLLVLPRFELRLAVEVLIDRRRVRPGAGLRDHGGRQQEGDQGQNGPSKDCVFHLYPPGSLGPPASFDAW